MLTAINYLASLLIWAVRGETPEQQDAACNRRR